MRTIARILSLLLVPLAVVPSARAQLEVSLQLPNVVVLRAEDVPAIVTIRNQTGRQIPVGGKDGYDLIFDIKGADGLPVLANEQSPPLAYVLAPGAVTTVTNNLYRCYRIIDTSQASVVARVDYAGTSYLSTKLFLNIQDGAECGRLQVQHGDRTTIQTLRTLLRGGHEHLFLRVDDAAGGWTFGATDLGSFLRTTPPRFMLDRAGQSHILHRSGPAQFTYHVAGHDGSLLRRENFSGDYKTVSMTAGEKGEIIVNGMPAAKSDRPQILQQTPFRPDLHPTLGTEPRP